MGVETSRRQQLGARGALNRLEIAREVLNFLAFVVFVLDVIVGGVGTRGMTKQEWPKSILSSARAGAAVVASGARRVIGCVSAVVTSGARRVVGLR